jgi:hypothetical protein
MTNQPCSATAEPWQQRGGGSRSAVAAAVVAMMTTIKMKATAAAEARRQWQRRLDHSLHDLTPLPAQAGEDAGGVHLTPPTTTALFGFGFLANFIQ